MRKNHQFNFWGKIINKSIMVWSQMLYKYQVLMLQTSLNCALMVLNMMTKRTFYFDTLLLLTLLFPDTLCTATPVRECSPMWWEPGTAWEGTRRSPSRSSGTTRSCTKQGSRSWRYWEESTILILMINITVSGEKSLIIFLKYSSFY